MFGDHCTGEMLRINIINIMFGDHCTGEMLRINSETRGSCESHCSVVILFIN